MQEAGNGWYGTDRIVYPARGGPTGAPAPGLDSRACVLHLSGVPSRAPTSATDPAGFPPTGFTLLQRLASADARERARGFEVLARLYWRPVYTHLRLKWQLDPPDAEDLTQEFLAGLHAGNTLGSFDPARGRFRTFLRGCLDHQAANARRAGQRLKRGGGVAHLSLDFTGAERDLAAGAVDGEAVLEARFHAEWVTALFAAALEEFRRRADDGRHAVHLALFERYDLRPAAGAERPTYAALAREFALPATQVTNFLAWARREFRRALLDTLRAGCASEEEFRAEARELLGTDAA